MKKMKKETLSLCEKSCDSTIVAQLLLHLFTLLFNKSNQSLVYFVGLQHNTIELNYFLNTLFKKKKSNTILVIYYIFMSILVNGKFSPTIEKSAYVINMCQGLSIDLGCIIKYKKIISKIRHICHVYGLYIYETQNNPKILYYHLLLSAMEMIL
jgi:hypothetical protein